MREASGGNIYDLGYRHYDGMRLGRRQAVEAMFVQSLRSVFGIGRPLSSKIGPWLLVGIAFLPAVAHLGAASISTGQVELFKPEDYSTIVQVVLALFVAVVAPELMGRDQRTRTLSLYFSRAIVRDDDVLTKSAALFVAMLGMTLGPQLVLFVGNGVALEDLGAYVEDRWTEIPAAVASSFLVCALYSGIGVAIAGQTSRRAYSTIAIIAFLVISSVVGATLVESSDGGGGRYGLLLSPFFLAEGLTYWFFNATPEPDDALATADIWGGLYALTAVAITLFCLVVSLRRYRSIQA